ncbi:hypothetical protein ACIQFP_26670 [Nocardiopsis alba]
MENVRTELALEEFLVEPLDAHEHGLAAGIEAALTEITARVASWSEEVAA